MKRIKLIQLINADEEIEMDGATSSLQLEILIPKFHIFARAHCLVSENRGEGFKC